MKDIFKGNIKDSKSAIISLVAFSIFMFVGTIILLLTALFYRNCEPDARIILFIFAAISFTLAIMYPVAAIYFVRRMDKFPYMARTFFKDCLYVDNKNKKHN